MRRSIAGAGFVIMLGFAVPLCAEQPGAGQAGAGQAGAQPDAQPPAQDLRITFLGDIMGHEVNYRMEDFHDIYRGVRPFFQSDDLTFANLEFPLDPSRPSSGYPYFNGTPAYLAAALDAGVNLFSVANNHAFDGGEEGVFQTIRALERQRTAGRFLAYSGTRGNPWRPFSAETIVRKGIRIGFIAVSQFLNEPDEGRYIHVVDYADPAQSAAFLSYVRGISPLYDLFIVSYHGDREYVQSPSAEKRAFFRSLLEAGAHIVVGHHPHVIQDYEIVESRGARRVAMYSMGNFISGMTWMLAPEKLRGMLAATGESYMMRVTVRCGAGGCSVRDADPVPIANYADENLDMVVAPMGDLVDGTVKVSPAWQAYYARRLAMMKEFLRIR